jgi:hypothetical protein
MRSRTTKSLLTITAIAALALPAGAEARRGADDGPGHARHGVHRSDDGHRHGARHGKRHGHRHGRHGRHGAHHGPNHR